MKNLAMIAGLLGIFVSLAAQLFAINDDNYHFGNIWFIGVLGGIIGTLSAFSININNKRAAVLIILSLFLGFAGVGSLYSVSALLQLLTLALLAHKQFRMKGDYNTNE